MEQVVNGVKTGVSQLGELVEADSEWCNSDVTYSWSATTRYECSGTTSYYLYQKYEQRWEQDSLPAYPNVWSINGDGTKSLNKKMDNDPACGYVPPVEPIYRWVNMDISTNWICDDCEQPSTIYRWIKTDNTTCVEDTPTTIYRWIQTSGTTCIENN